MGLQGPDGKPVDWRMEAWLSGFWGVAQYLFATGKAGELGKAARASRHPIRSEQFSGFVDPVPEIVGTAFGMANGQNDGGIVPGEIGYKVSLERWGQIDSPDPKFSFMEKSWRLSDQSQAVIHPGIKFVSKGRIDLEEELGQLQ